MRKTRWQIDEVRAEQASKGLMQDERIIKGRPFGVRFECLAQTSPGRSTLL
jgi:hypothetical protein